jgi:hypothetical protein
MQRIRRRSNGGTASGRKKADRAHEKVALRHKIGIKICDELPIGVDKRRVDVAGLGVTVVRSPASKADTPVIARCLRPHMLTAF